MTCRRRPGPVAGSLIPCPTRFPTAASWATLPLLIAGSLSCGDATAPSGLLYSYREPPQVNDGWRTGSLADVDIDADPLVALMDRIMAADEHLIHSIVIVKSDRLVFEEYFSGYRFSLAQQDDPVVFDRETAHNLASVTKSVTATLVGIALDRGSIGTLNQAALTSFPEYSDLSGGGKNAITLEHLITMTSGLEWDETTYWYPDPRNDIIRLFNTNAPLRHVLAKPLVAQPGTEFNYSGGCTNVLGEVVARATGMGLDEFARRSLFSPLGISDHVWQYLPGGLVFASGDLRLRPRDMAKIGYLYLREGIWEGERLLSRDWITAAARRHVPLDWGWADGYGYGWWTTTYEIDGRRVDTYFASGWGGQQISVVPDMDLVVVFTGGAYYEDALLSPDEMMRDYVLPAAR